MGKVCLLVFIGLWCSGCSWFNQKKEQILVGYIDAFSGSRAVFGIATRSGIQMAVDEVNQSGGISGKQLQLIVRDDGGEPEKSKQVAEELLKTHPDIKAFLGATASSRSLVIAPVAQEQGVPMVTSSSTHPKVTAIGDHIFRVCFVDTFQGPAMAEFARKNLKFKTVAIMRDLNTQYSLSLSEFFKKRFIKLGGEVVSDQVYRGGDVDYAKQLTAIKKHKPEAIYVPGYFSEVARIVKQAREMEIKAQFLGGDGWDSSDLIKAVSAGLEGAHYTSHFSLHSDDPVYLLFKEKYEKQHKRSPDAFSALGYDAANVLIQAMKQANPISRENIRRLIASTKDFHGVTGMITLDKNRNAIKPVVILKIEGNKALLVKASNPN